MSFDIADFDPTDFVCFDDATDPIVEIMLTMKDLWGLTGDLSTGSVVFGTRFYDKNVMFPQLVVLPLGGSPTPPLSIGSTDAFYKSQPTIGVNIYVRPKQDSNTSLGWAKNTIYQLRKESERILRSGSQFNNETENRAIFLVGWDRKDDLNVRPPLLQLFGKCIVVKYVKGV